MMVLRVRVENRREDGKRVRRYAVVNMSGKDRYAYCRSRESAERFIVSYYHVHEMYKLFFSKLPPTDAQDLITEDEHGFGTQQTIGNCNRYYSDDNLSTDTDLL